MRTTVCRRARRTVAGLLLATLIAGGVSPAMAEDAGVPGQEQADAALTPVPEEQQSPVLDEDPAGPVDEEAEQTDEVGQPQARGSEADEEPAADAVEAPSETERPAITPFAADPPEAQLAQSELSSTKAASLNAGAGLSINIGQHPEPGEHRILVDGQENARVVPDAGGRLAWTTIPAKAGSYTVVVEAPSGERSAPSTLTLVADPTVSLPSFTNDRIVQHRGYSIEAAGFAPGEQVSVTALHGFTYANGQADDAGRLRFHVNAQPEAAALSASPTLVLESATRKVEHVVDRRDPSFQVPGQVSVLDLFFGEVVITGENLPEDFTVELEIDGETVDSMKVVDGQVEFWFPDYLEVGRHEIRISDHVGTLYESTVELVDAEFVPDLSSTIAGRWLDRATHAVHGFDLRIEGIEPGSWGLMAFLDADGEPLDIFETEPDQDGVVELEIPSEFFEELDAGEYTVEAIFFADMPMLMAAPMAPMPQVQFLSDDFVLTDLAVSAPKTVTQQQLEEGVVIAGSGFQPGEPVTIVVNDLIAGQQLAGADTRVELGLPTLIPAGEAEIVLVSEAGYVGTMTTVVDEPVAPGADDEPSVTTTPAAVRGRLPATGAELSGGLLASAALLVLGGAAILSRQRRRV